MKRFYTDVAVEEVEGGFRVTLDSRPVKTQGGRPQIVPTRALAELLAGEWATQGEEIDPTTFTFRDFADFAIDQVRQDRADTVRALLAYAETDTLCYRADPDDPLYRRQHELWEPLLAAAEAHHGVRFERASGILHRAQPPETLAALLVSLEGEDEFTLAGLRSLASLAASLTVGVAALDPAADAPALFAAANAEEDWQAEQWGWEWTAEERRAGKLADFEKAAAFARAARTP
ncbi:MAG TPA: ATP12 family protein [Croceibacterium sp.]|nr:ATP12 family protein [Croceibacterium sp.]